MSESGRQILISTFFFAVMQICVKNLVHIPTSQVVFVRAMISLIICFVWLRRSGIPMLGTHRGWLIGRGVAGTLALFTFFYSVQQIPLASAVTLQYLSPVFTVIIASFAFRESATLAQWLFMLVSFIGVFFIQGYDDRVSPTLALICIFSAICSAVAYNIIRKIGKREHPLVIVFYFPLVTSVILGPVAFYEWQAPQGADAFFLVATGVSVHFAQIYMTKAYQADKAANIVTLKYIGAIFALLVGYFLFDETFAETALFGMALVATGAIGANQVTARIRRKDALATRV